MSTAFEAYDFSSGLSWENRSERLSTFAKTRLINSTCSLVGLLNASLAITGGDAYGSTGTFSSRVKLNSSIYITQDESTMCYPNRDPGALDASRVILVHYLGAVCIFILD